jgi:L-xylulokinase
MPARCHDMKTSIFIGIDMGSTGLKAVAFESGTGKGLAAAGSALPLQRTRAGGCELAAAAIAGALQDALRGVARQLGERVNDVRALGCTGHGAGLYVLDAQDRLLRGRAVASTDQRAAARARALVRPFGAALAEAVGCGPWAGQPTLVAAELIAAGELRRDEIRHLLFAKDYLGLLLTGERTTDASDASTAGLLSLATGKPSPMPFEVAGVPELADTLTPLRLSGTVLGRLRPALAEACGLPAGLPVAVGTIDLLASLDAVDAPARGRAVAVLGTWCVNAVVAPVRDTQPAVGGVVHFGAADRRLYLENSPSSMANLAWLARTVGFADAAAVVDAAMTVPLGADGLRFMPFINGGGVSPDASGGFIGLAAHHERQHLARAVVDAVLALHARHLDRLARAGLAARSKVAALGGGARDRRMVQLLADFIGHPVERCGDDETGARGAALYAARAAGAPADALPAPRDIVEPAGDAGAHAAFRAGFDALLDSLAPAFAQQAGAQR